MIRWSLFILNFLLIQYHLLGQNIQIHDSAKFHLIDFKKSGSSYKNTYRDSNNIQISLLTLSPGNDLYSVFGHSAIRVKDPHIGTDIVYNYGTFDFEDPEFLPKFIRGELDYFISQETYEDFIGFYGSEGRGLIEQVLALNRNQKKDIQEFLFHNMEPDNRFYRYNFLYNNCTTKLRDIIDEFRDQNTQTANLITTKNMSFRDGLHYYLDRANQPWIKLGIDIILGSRIDKKMSNFESQFLPDFLEEGMDKTTINGQKLVSHKINVLPNQISTSKSFSLTPLISFTLLLLLYVGLLFTTGKISMISNVIEISLYVITGIIGCVLLFLWTYTFHEQSKENFNLLWAWPTHILAVFFYKKKSKILKIYWGLLFLFMLILAITWFIIPQELNLSLLPLTLILGISGFRNYKNV